MITNLEKRKNHCLKNIKYFNNYIRRQSRKIEKAKKYYYSNLDELIDEKKRIQNQLKVYKIKYKRLIMETLTAHQKINLRSHFPPNRKIFMRSERPYKITNPKDWEMELNNPFRSEIHLKHEELDKKQVFNTKI